MPLAELATAMTAALSTAKRGDWQESLNAASAKLGSVLSLAAWQASAADLLATQAALQAELAAFDGDPQLARDLQVFANGCSKWQKAKEGFDQAAQALADGSISACLTSISSTLVTVGARAEFDELKSVAERCRGAFAVLEKELDLAVAKSDLQAAREVASRMSLLPSGVADRIDAWQVSISNLESKAAGMVPIAAGTTKNPRASVEAFFVSATECSNQEFRRFVKEVNDVVAGDTAEARFASVAARLEGSGMDSKRLDDMLRKSGRSDDLRPVNVSWFEAAAYCVWYGYSLPKREEWALAAFGDGNKYQFPWGNEDSMKPEMRSTSSRAVDVNDGGLSWRASQGAKVHHLAGNAAEWLAADVADPNFGLQGECVGSGYKDRPTGRTTEDLAAGRTVKRIARDQLAEVAVWIAAKAVSWRLCTTCRASLSWRQDEELLRRVGDLQAPRLVGEA